MNKGRLTICRHGIIDEDYINLRIIDDKSGLQVIEVNIPMIDFARAITNLSGVNCEFNVFSNNAKTWGKKKEIKRIYFDNPDKFNKEKSRENVKKHFEENYGNTEWEIWSTGTTEQQNDKLYHYTICRYVESEL